MKENDVGGACDTHGSGEKFTRFWWESPKERDHSEDTGVDERMESKWIFGVLGGRGWSGFTWLRTRTGGWLL
jgi:hypothetical protein